LLDGSLRTQLPPTLFSFVHDKSLSRHPLQGNFELGRQKGEGTCVGAVSSVAFPTVELIQKLLGEAKFGIELLNRRIETSPAMLSPDSWDVKKEIFRK
jgi:hypothetical protein